MAGARQNMRVRIPSYTYMCSVHVAYFSSSPSLPPSLYLSLPFSFLPPSPPPSFPPTLPPSRRQEEESLTAALALSAAELKDQEKEDTPPAPQSTDLLLDLDSSKDSSLENQINILVHTLLMKPSYMYNIHCIL